MAVVLLDQAGWHTTAKLDIPENISLMPFSHQVTGTQSGRKRLAILAPELALQPRLRRPRHGGRAGCDFQFVRKR